MNRMHTKVARESTSVLQALSVHFFKSLTRSYTLHVSENAIHGTLRSVLITTLTDTALHAQILFKYHKI